MNLARAALLVAQEEYPQLSVDLYLARLEQVAEEVKDRLANETAPLVVLDEVIRTLFGRRKFSGNRDAYHDPRNSFLNDVLDRGTGIPLTLGIVLLEVGWRLGLPLEGVNFPGNFLVRYLGSQIRLLIDPFDEGKVRFEDQAQELLDQGYGEGDLALRLTQLKYYLRAVGNAILDHKMHCTEMTDEEALHLLSERAFQSDGEARLKIIRAKQTSVQLSTYFVGRMAIYRLRQEIQRELGDKFDLGRFHEAAIDHGSVPVKYLPELVRKRLKQPR